MTTNNAINFFSFTPTTMWTPDLQFNGVDTGITYSTNVGLYAQIDNVVFYFCLLVMTSIGSIYSGSELVTVAGLPINSNNSISYIGTGSFGPSDGIIPVPIVYNNGATNTIYIQTDSTMDSSGNPSSASSLVQAQLNDNSILQLSGYYLAM